MSQWQTTPQAAPLGVELLGERALPAVVNPSFLGLFAASQPDAFAEFVQDNNVLFAGANPGLFGFFGATDGDFSDFFGDFGGLFAAAPTLAAFPPASPLGIVTQSAANSTFFPAFAGSELGDFQDFFDASRQFFPNVATPTALLTNNVLANLATVNPQALITQFAAVNPTILAGFAGAEANDFQEFAENAGVFALFAGVQV